MLIEKCEDNFECLIKVAPLTKIDGETLILYFNSGLVIRGYYFWGAGGKTFDNSIIVIIFFYSALTLVRPSLHVAFFLCVSLCYHFW